MEENFESNFWESAREATKSAQENGSDPLLWAMKLYSDLNSNGVSMPSIELAELLISLCWENNVAIMWKFIEKTLVLNMVPPLLLLALFSTRFFALLFSAFHSSCLVGEKTE